MTTYYLNTYSNGNLDAQLDLGEHETLADAIAFARKIGDVMLSEGTTALDDDGVTSDGTVSVCVEEEASCL